MVKLSKHFSLEEFCKTSSPLANVPTRDSVINLCYGVNNILEPLRDYLGKPIIINSGYRSPSVNKAVGGVSNSQHLIGCAADIHLDKSDIDKAFRYLQTNSFCDQVLGGSSFIHISWTMTSTPRQCYKQNYYNY